MLKVKSNVEHIDQTHQNLVEWFRGNHTEAEIKLKLGDVTDINKYDSYGGQNDFDRSVIEEKQLRIEDTITKHEKTKIRQAKKEYKESIKPLYDESNPANT